MKVAHVERGSIETLLKEIAASLTVYTQDEADPLRLQIYGCTMQKCDSELQSYIAYFQIPQRKLLFLNLWPSKCHCSSMGCIPSSRRSKSISKALRTQPTSQKQTQASKNFARGHCHYDARCQCTPAAIPTENIPVTQQCKFIRSKNDIT